MANWDENMELSSPRVKTGQRRIASGLIIESLLILKWHFNLDPETLFVPASLR